jgi:hypothetical protein
MTAKLRRIVGLLGPIHGNVTLLDPGGGKMVPTVERACAFVLVFRTRDGRDLAVLFGQIEGGGIPGLKIQTWGTQYL